MKFLRFSAVLMIVLGAFTNAAIAAGSCKDYGLKIYLDPNDSQNVINNRYNCYWNTNGDVGAAAVYDGVTLPDIQTNCGWTGNPKCQFDGYYAYTTGDANFTNFTYENHRFFDDDLRPVGTQAMWDELCLQYANTNTSYVIFTAKWDCSGTCERVTFAYNGGQIANPQPVTLYTELLKTGFYTDNVCTIPYDANSDPALLVPTRGDWEFSGYYVGDQVFDDQGHITQNGEGFVPRTSPVELSAGWKLPYDVGCSKYGIIGKLENDDMSYLTTEKECGTCTASQEIRGWNVFINNSNTPWNPSLLEPGFHLEDVFDDYPNYPTGINTVWIEPECESICHKIAFNNNGQNSQTNENVSLYRKKGDLVNWYMRDDCDSNSIISTPQVSKPQGSNVTFAGYHTQQPYFSNKTQVFTSTEDGSGYLTVDDNVSGNWNVTSDTILYANWTPNVYTVTLDPNSGSFGANGVNEIYEQYDTGWATTNTNQTTFGSLTLSGNQLPTRTGYTFNGYADAQSNGSPVGTLSNGTWTAPVADTVSSNGTTWYAQWTPNIYTVTLDENGGSVGRVIVVTTIYEKYDTGWATTNTPQTTFAALTLSENQLPTRLGYTFNGYADARSNGSPVGQFDNVNNIWTAPTGANTVSSDTIWYAQWTPKTISVTYNNGGHGTTPDQDSCTYDGTLILPVALSEAGYTFDGWTISGNSNSPIAAGTQIDCDYATLGSNGAQTVLITGTWTGNQITIDWNENGGDALTNGSCTYGADLTLGAAPNYANHVFNGWTLANFDSQIPVYYAANDTISNGCVSSNLGVDTGTSIGITANWCSCNSPLDPNATCTPSSNGHGTCSYTTSCPAGYTISGDDTANPTCTPNNYTITLNANFGNSTNTTPGSGTLYTTYDTGVYLDSARTNQMSTSTNPISMPQQSATVTFDSNGGNPVSPSTNTYNFAFDGFYAAANGSAQYISNTGHITNGTAPNNGIAAAEGYTANAIWYAHWTPATMGSDLPTPTFANHQFVGWFTAATGGTPIDQNTPVTENTTVYAHWTECTGSQFYENGGCASCSTGYTANQTPAGRADCYKICYKTCTQQNPNPNCPQHATCTYIDTDAQVPGREYENNPETCVIDGSSMCDFTFTCNTGYTQDADTCVPAQYEITLNSNSTTGTPGTTKLYTIYQTGVYLNSDRTTESKMSPSENPITAPTRYVTLSLDANGGTFTWNGNSVGNATDNIDLSFDGYYNNTTNTKYIEYNNNEWYINVRGINIAQAVMNNNQTWYARWQPATINTLLPTPTYANRQFDGWYDNNNNPVTTPISNVTENISLTAHWTECSANQNQILLNDQCQTCTCNELTGVVQGSCTVSVSNNECTATAQCMEQYSGTPHITCSGATCTASCNECGQNEISVGGNCTQCQCDDSTSALCGELAISGNLCTWPNMACAPGYVNLAQNCSNDTAHCAPTCTQCQCTHGTGAASCGNVSTINNICTWNGGECDTGYSTIAYSCSGNGNMTCTATCTPNEYTITYQPNGDYGDAYNQTVTYNAGFTTASANDVNFNQPGYIVDYWEIVSGGTNTFPDNVPLGQQYNGYLDTVNTTLQAHWQQCATGTYQNGNTCEPCPSPYTNSVVSSSSASACYQTCNCNQTGCPTVGQNGIESCTYITSTGIMYNDNSNQCVTSVVDNTPLNCAYIVTCATNYYPSNDNTECLKQDQATIKLDDNVAGSHGTSVNPDKLYTTHNTGIYSDPARSTAFASLTNTPTKYAVLTLNADGGIVTFNGITGANPYKNIDFTFDGFYEAANTQTAFIDHNGDLTRDGENTGLGYSTGTYTWVAHWTAGTFNAGNLPTPTRNGYIFTGWYDNGSAVESASLTISVDKTLTAKWAQCDCSHNSDVDSCTVDTNNNNECTASVICAAGYANPTTSCTGTACIASCTAVTYTATFDCNAPYFNTATTTDTTRLGESITIPSVSCTPTTTYANWVDFGAGWRSTYPSNVTNPTTNQACSVNNDTDGGFTVASGSNYTWNCPTDLTFIPAGVITERQERICCSENSGDDRCSDFTVGPNNSTPLNQGDETVDAWMHRVCADDCPNSGVWQFFGWFVKVKNGETLPQQIQTILNNNGIRNILNSSQTLLPWATDITDAYYYSDPSIDRIVPVGSCFYTATYSCGDGTGNGVTDQYVAPYSGSWPGGAINGQSYTIKTFGNVGCTAPANYSFNGWELSFDGINAYNNNPYWGEENITWPYSKSGTFTAQWTGNCVAVNFEDGDGTNGSEGTTYYRQAGVTGAANWFTDSNCTTILNTPIVVPTAPAGKRFTGYNYIDNNQNTGIFSRTGYLTQDGTNWSTDAATTTLYAQYVDLIHCNCGEYLPANSTICASCPAGSWCPAGDYEQKTTVQGRNACNSSCPDATSNTGACAVTDCFVQTTQTCVPDPDCTNCTFETSEDVTCTKNLSPIGTCSGSAWENQTCTESQYCPVNGCVNGYYLDDTSCVQEASYEITLNNNFTATGTPGTPTLYTIHNTGVYLNPARTSASQMSTSANSISMPQQSATVTFDSNGGNPVSPLTNTYNFAFDGFYAAINGSTKYISDTGYITNGTVPNNGIAAAKNYTANATWYAHWTPDTMGSDLPTPTFANHQFAGWFTAATGGTRITQNTPVTENTTVYAHWTECDGANEILLNGECTACTCNPGNGIVTGSCDAYPSDGTTCTATANCMDQYGDLTVNCIGANCDVSCSACNPSNNEITIDNQCVSCGSCTAGTGALSCTFESIISNACTWTYGCQPGYISPVISCLESGNRNCTVTCTQCGPNTYQSGNTCVPCNAGFTSPAGSDSVDDCYNNNCTVQCNLCDKIVDPHMEPGTCKNIPETLPGTQIQGQDCQISSGTCDVEYDCEEGYEHNPDNKNLCENCATGWTASGDKCEKVEYNILCSSGGLLSTKLEYGETYTVSEPAVLGGACKACQSPNQVLNGWYISTNDDTQNQPVDEINAGNFPYSITAGTTFGEKATTITFTPICDDGTVKYMCYENPLADYYNDTVTIPSYTVKSLDYLTRESNDTFKCDGLSSPKWYFSGNQQIYTPDAQIDTDSVVVTGETFVPGYRASFNCNNLGYFTGNAPAAINVPLGHTIQMPNIPCTVDREYTGWVATPTEWEYEINSSLTTPVSDATCNAITGYTAATDDFKWNCPTDITFVPRIVLIPHYLYLRCNDNSNQQYDQVTINYGDNVSTIVANYMQNCPSGDCPPGGYGVRLGWRVSMNGGGNLPASLTELFNTDGLLPADYFVNFDSYNGGDVDWTNIQVNPVSECRYDVTYNCGTGNGNGRVDEDIAVSGKEYTVKSRAWSDCTAQTGYEFAGWEFNGNTYAGDGNATLIWPSSASGTFTAQWTGSCLGVTFNDGNGTNGAGAANTTLYKIAGGTAWFNDANCTNLVSSPSVQTPTPTNPDQHFTGYFASGDNNAVFDFGGDVTSYGTNTWTINAATVLTAQYSACTAPQFYDDATGNCTGCPSAYSDNPSPQSAADCYKTCEVDCSWPTCPGTLCNYTTQKITGTQHANESTCNIGSVNPYCEYTITECPDGSVISANGQSCVPCDADEISISGTCTQCQCENTNSASCGELSTSGNICTWDMNCESGYINLQSHCNNDGTICEPTCEQNVITLHLSCGPNSTEWDEPLTQAQYNQIVDMPAYIQNLIDTKGNCSGTCPGGGTSERFGWQVTSSTTLPTVITNALNNYGLLNANFNINAGFLDLDGLSFAPVNVCKYDVVYNCGTGTGNDKTDVGEAKIVQGLNIQLNYTVQTLGWSGCQPAANEVFGGWRFNKNNRTYASNDQFAWTDDSGAAQFTAQWSDCDPGQYSLNGTCTDCPVGYRDSLAGEATSESTCYRTCSETCNPNCPTGDGISGCTPTVVSYPGKRFYPNVEGCTFDPEPDDPWPDCAYTVSCSAGYHPKSGNGGKCEQDLYIIQCEDYSHKPSMPPLYNGIGDYEWNSAELNAYEYEDDTGEEGLIKACYHDCPSGEIFAGWDVWLGWTGEEGAEPKWIETHFEMPIEIRPDAEQYQNEHVITLRPHCVNYTAYMCYVGDNQYGIQDMVPSSINQHGEAEYTVKGFDWYQEQLIGNDGNKCPYVPDSSFNWWYNNGDRYNADQPLQNVAMDAIIGQTFYPGYIATFNCEPTEWFTPGTSEDHLVAFGGNLTMPVVACIDAEGRVGNNNNCNAVCTVNSTYARWLDISAGWTAKIETNLDTTVQNLGNERCNRGREITVSDASYTWNCPTDLTFRPAGVVTTATVRRCCIAGGNTCSNFTVGPDNPDGLNSDNQSYTQWYSQNCGGSCENDGTWYTFGQGIVLQDDIAPTDADEINAILQQYGGRTNPLNPTQYLFPVDSNPVGLLGRYSSMDYIASIGDVGSCLYKVTYDCGAPGGTGDGSVDSYNPTTRVVAVAAGYDYTVKTLAGASCQAVNSNFTFAGWKLTLENDETYTPTFPAEGDTITWPDTDNGTLTAQWNGACITVNFVNNPGTDGQTQTMSKHAGATDWYANADCSGNPVQNPTVNTPTPPTGQNFNGYFENGVSYAVFGATGDLTTYGADWYAINNVTLYAQYIQCDPGTYYNADEGDCKACPHAGDDNYAPYITDPGANSVYDCYIECSDDCIEGGCPDGANCTHESRTITWRHYYPQSYEYGTVNQLCGSADENLADIIGQNIDPYCGYTITQCPDGQYIDNTTCEDCPGDFNHSDDNATTAKQCYKDCDIPCTSDGTCTLPFDELNGDPETCSVDTYSNVVTGKLYNTQGATCQGTAQSCDITYDCKPGYTYNTFTHQCELACNVGDYWDGTECKTCNNDISLPGTWTSRPPYNWGIEQCYRNCNTTCTDATAPFGMQQFLQSLGTKYQISFYGNEQAGINTCELTHCPLAITDTLTHSLAAQVDFHDGLDGNGNAGTRYIVGTTANNTTLDGAQFGWSHVVGAGQQYGNYTLITYPVTTAPVATPVSNQEFTGYYHPIDGTTQYVDTNLALTATNADSVRGITTDATGVRNLYAQYSQCGPGTYYNAAEGDCKACPHAGDDNPAHYTTDPGANSVYDCYIECSDGCIADGCPDGANCTYEPRMITWRHYHPQSYEYGTVNQLCGSADENLADIIGQDINPYCDISEKDCEEGYELDPETDECIQVYTVLCKEGSVNTRIGDYLYLGDIFSQNNEDLLGTCYKDGYNVCSDGTEQSGWDVYIGESETPEPDPIIDDPVTLTAGVTYGENATIIKLAAHCVPCAANAISVNGTCIPCLCENTNSASCGTPVDTSENTCDWPWVCEPGYISLNPNCNDDGTSCEPTCTPCESGMYQDGDECKPCEYGSTSTDGSTSCTPIESRAIYNCGRGEGAAPGGTSGISVSYGDTHIVRENNGYDGMVQCHLENAVFSGWKFNESETYYAPGNEIEWNYTTDQHFTAVYCDVCSESDHCTVNTSTPGVCTKTCNTGYRMVDGRCVAEEYLITYQPNGGYPEQNVTQSVTYGVGFDTKGAIYSKDHSILDIWKVLSGGTGTFNNNEARLSEHYTYQTNAATVLQAHWTECDPGWISLENKCVQCKADYYQYGDECEPCEEGYTSTAGSTNCTAKKTFAIYNCGNGATGTPPESVQMTYGETHTVRENNGCIRDGYTFAGWQFSGNDRSYDPDDRVIWNYETDQKFTAQWCPNCQTIENGTCTLVAEHGQCEQTIKCNYGYRWDDVDKKCVPNTWTLTYKPNGGLPNTDNVEGGHVFGTSFTTLSGTTYKKDNHKLVSWNPERGGQFTGLRQEYIYNYDGDTVLSAKWAQCTCERENWSNGVASCETKSTDSNTCDATATCQPRFINPVATCGDGTTCRAECTECRPGYISVGNECKPCEAGEYQDANNCELCPAGYTSLPASDSRDDCNIPLKYTIHYESGLGTGRSHERNQTVTYDAPFHTEPGTTFTNAGYVMTWWNVVSGGQNTFSGGRAELDHDYRAYVDANDTTLRAKWERCECSYDANTATGCTVSVNNNECVFGGGCLPGYVNPYETTCTNDRLNCTVACKACPDGTYERDGVCVNCPENYTSLEGAKNIDECYLYKCDEGQHIEHGKCVSNIQACVVPNALNASGGVREWDENLRAYGPCVTQGCDDGYHVSGNACVKDIETCTVANGRGEHSWNSDTNEWYECKVQTCDAGYYQSNNECVECENRRDANDEIAVSGYIYGCEIAACMYQGQKYALQNNECVPICEDATDDTGSKRWDDNRKQCIRTCNPGYKMW